MRCLTLGQELRKRGAEVTFVCRALEGHMGRFIREDQGFSLCLLGPGRPIPAGTPAGPPHRDWLETDWKTDAEETASRLGETMGGPPDWLVVDHYALDRMWESSLRDRAGRILVIDDLADRPHDCDVLLDQNLYPAMESRYRGLVPSHCRQFLGPSFALLRGEFRAARERLRPRDGAIRRVLAFFGGADPTNETRKAFEAWMRAGRGLELDVVVGAANPHRAELEALCAGRPGVTCHVQTGDMAGLMAAADLALGAGGTATWERCCLALPSLCVTIAENQRPVARAAAANGFLRYLGHYPDVDAEALAEALRACLADPEAVAAMAAKAGSAVDGLGAPRLAERMMRPREPEAAALTLRPASMDDMELYFRWANDPDVRGNAFSPSPIPLESHRRWFAGKLADPAAALFVLERDGVPAGQIRFDLEGDEAHIDFSVAREHRGKGLGRELLRRGMDGIRSRRGRDLAFLGTVKTGNAASAGAFRAAGFAEGGTQIIKGEECLIFRSRTAG